jgi:hypothetical protein
MPAQYNQEPVRLSHRLTLSTEQEDGSSDATWPFVLDSGLAEADVIVTLQPGPCRLTLRLAALEADRAMALQCIVLTPQS